MFDLRCQASTLKQPRTAKALPCPAVDACCAGALALEPPPLGLPLLKTSLSPSLLPACPCTAPAAMEALPWSHYLSACPLQNLPRLGGSAFSPGDDRVAVEPSSALPFAVSLVPIPFACGRLTPIVIEQPCLASACLGASLCRGASFCILSPASFCSLPPLSSTQVWQLVSGPCPPQSLRSSRVALRDSYCLLPSPTPLSFCLFGRAAAELFVVIICAAERPLRCLWKVSRKL